MSKNVKKGVSAKMTKVLAGILSSARAAAPRAPGKKNPGHKTVAKAPKRKQPRTLHPRDTSAFPSQKMGGAVKKRFIIVEWDEYVTEVAGSVGFVTTAYPINPGQSQLFPWLSKMAVLWEKYVIELCEPYYKHEVSQFATNGQAGKVMLSCDYDASDPAPTSKQQVEDTWPHIDCMPYQDCTLRLNKREMSNSVALKYVRPGAQPANTDIKFYDCGVVYVSTSGNTNTTVIGEFRIRYRVRLEVPVLEGVGAGYWAHFYGPAPTTGNNFASLTLQAGNTLSGVTLGTNVINFPVTVTGGNFMIQYVSTGSTAPYPAYLSSTGCTLLKLLVGNTQSSESTLSSTVNSMTLFVTVTAASPTITFTPGTATTPISGDLFITGIPYGSLSLTAPQLEDRLATLEHMLACRAVPHLSSSSSSSSSSDSTLFAQWQATKMARLRREHDPGHRGIDSADEESKDDLPPFAQSCPNCDGVKHALSFGGFCSRNCLYESDIADGIVTQRVQGDDVILTLGPRHIVSSGSHKKDLAK